MKRAGRPLTAEEAALWKRVAATVRPIDRRPSRYEEQQRIGGGAGAEAEPRAPGRAAAPAPAPQPPSRGGLLARPREALGKVRRLEPGSLDSSWDRKLGKGIVQPDFTLDLHGHTLESAHARLDHGIVQALAQGARVLLLITGKPRPADELGDRGNRRGAIRARFLDWLAAGPHASKIAAVRPAHPRHGGAGAVYIVLKRPWP